MRDAGTQVSLLDVTVSVIDTGTQAVETGLSVEAVIECFRSRGWIVTSSPCPEAYGVTVDISRREFETQ